MSEKADALVVKNVTQMMLDLISLTCLDGATKNEREYAISRAKHAQRCILGLDAKLFFEPRKRRPR